MELNQKYEQIIEVNGDCFRADNGPNCKECPFLDKCLKLIIENAVSIKREQRVEWALNKLVEGAVFDEEV